MTSLRKSNFDLFKYLRIPRFLEMPAIGVDISDSAIRFVELTKFGHSFIPRKCGERKLAPGVVVSGAIIKKDEVIKVLSAIAKEEKYMYVRASLPESKAYVFNVSVPNLPNINIPEAVSFRIEENAPISAKEALFDYTPIGKNEKGEIELSVTAVQESVVREYIDMYAQAGLTVRSFDLESRAIARALVACGDPKTYLIVHIEESRTVFSIVRNGVVRFTSTLYVGSKNLTSNIERVFSIDEKSAEKMKGEYSEETHERIFESIIGALASIKDEIHKLSIYWYTHKEAGTPGIQKIDEILLSGKDVTIPGVLEYVGRNSKMSVRIANPWGECFSYNEVIPSLALKESLNYVPVIGLSLPKKEDA